MMTVQSFSAIDASLGHTCQIREGRARDDADEGDRCELGPHLPCLGGVVTTTTTTTMTTTADRCELGPHRLLNVGRVDGLAPHLSVAAEDEAAERVGHVVAGLVGVDGRPVDVEIIEVPRGLVVANVAQHLPKAGQGRW